MRTRLRRDFMSAEHSRELFDPARGIEARKLGRDALGIAALGHSVVAIGARRHLRQMRDAQDLPPRADLP